MGESLIMVASLVVWWVLSIPGGAVAARAPLDELKIPRSSNSSGYFLTHGMTRDFFSR